MKKHHNRIEIIGAPENISLYIERQIMKYNLHKCEEAGNYFSDDYLLIVMDASQCTTTDDFFVEIGKKFKFESDIWDKREWRSFMYFNDLLHSIHCFVPQKKIRLIIKNLSNFSPEKPNIPKEHDLYNDFYADAHDLIVNFKNYLLPFYENEVKECYRKNFNIYYS